MSDKPTSGSASKVSVTIDSAVLRQARVAAKRSGKTLSAHISQALERDLRRQRMAELVAEFEAEHGAITPEEVAKAIASWRG
jgi:predicted transcriptional regulator